jgi:hypothetical protein
MDFTLAAAESAQLAGVIQPHPLITVTLRQPAGFFDQRSRR